MTYLSYDQSVLNDASGLWRWKRLVAVSETKLIDGQDAR
jgi:hypothetical protein